MITGNRYGKERATSIKKGGGRVGYSFGGLLKNTSKREGGIIMELKKILWPTDFSENSAHALPYVGSLTEKYQTEIHLLYVI